MKKIFFVMLMLCCALVAEAQQIGFTYQAVALDESKAEGFGRDSKGQVLLNQPLTVRFSIHEKSADGTVQYQEVHETTTDIFGIFRVVIGSGEKLLGTSLEALQWSDQSYYMQVELDLGNGFINMGEEIIVVPPFGLNNSIQLLNLSGTQLTISDGNSVDLGSLLNASRLSEVEVDAFVNNNGYLLLEVDGSVTNELQNLTTNGTAGHLAISDGNQITINVNDADADSLNEIQDLQLSGNQLTITNNPAATIINLSPYLGNNLTEEDVDNMVSNNGYLTTEVDGSITNEIQDLNLTGNTLSITNNPASTNIDLSPYRNVFEITNNITSNENGNYATDDFVYGSSSLDHPAAEGQRNRLFFDKSKGALRAGSTNDASWNDANRGFYSTAFGLNNIALGVSSFSVGENNNSLGASSTSLGVGNTSSGSFSFSAGTSNTASGYSSFAGGIGNLATGYNAFALGDNSSALGDYSKVFAHNSTAYSYGETVLGTLATAYTPVGDLTPTDRLFTIGNGMYDYNSTPPFSFTRSDALVMLKNGNTRLHGLFTIDADNVTGAGEQYTLPGQDGAANQVMTTDGNGNVTWSTPTTLTESDVDNFVSNNGYLTTEVDGSITNEIQDLNLTGNTLSITNNPASTNIDLSPYRNVFETTNAVTSNQNGNYVTDDFVFGSPSLESTGNTDHGNRIFFDKSKGAFRAGFAESDEWDNVNVGIFSLGLGWNNVSSGSYSTAFGAHNRATGFLSTAFGNVTIASGGTSTAFGFNTEASGASATAFGHQSEASGYMSLAAGNGTIASSFTETVLGRLNTTINPVSTNSWVNEDRLFTIGNGVGFSFSDRSDALVMLKNGNTRLHGLFTIDADNVTGAGEQYTLPGQDGAANQVMTTDGNGNVSWNTPTTLTESDVDNFVSNNGYLTTEVDGSITNEIQDLNLTGNTLSITNNAAPTNIDLTPYQNVFETTSNVTSNENGNYATDDFVFGSPQLADDGNPDHNARMFFDKSKGAFRVGSVSSFQNYWNDANVGQYSIAMGRNGRAAGDYSIAIGSGLALEDYSLALGHEAGAIGEYSVAIGRSAISYASDGLAFRGGNVFGQYGFAWGTNSESWGAHSMALGDHADAGGANSVSIGSFADTDANSAMALGTRVNAISAYETVIGSYNTIYNPLSVQHFNTNDRLFVIGNGGPPGNGIPLGNGAPFNGRSDALVMLKNGNTRLHGQLTIDADNITGAGEQYTLPGQDGAANQVMTTDGNGNVSWNTPTTLTESDVDNFVSNNGYLTTEVDGSITNEIQDLNLTGNTLSITNNAAPNNIDLTPYQNVFETTNSVTSNENGNYATDDFVFGSPQLADDGNVAYDARMFFDKSKGAFRAGRANSNEWNDENVGINSIGLGRNPIASGENSVSIGASPRSPGANSVSIGILNYSTGEGSIALGRFSQSVGTYSIAVGMHAFSTGANSIAVGGNGDPSSYTTTFASGRRSIALGSGTESSGDNSVAIGNGATATGANSYSIGNGGNSLGVGSMVIGTGTSTGTYSLSIGISNDAVGDFSTASGIGSQALGDYSHSFGRGNVSRSYGEYSIGYYNTAYSEINQSAPNLVDRLFVIGNGIASNNRSDAFVMLKNGNTRLHGLFTIDADNITGAGEQYTLPGQDGAANQVMTTDGNGNVSWNTPTTLTETDVDNFVSNNGYLTTEVDGSITNEIQDLNLTGNLLSITNNAAPTNIDLTPYQNIFETTNGVTSNENGSYTTDSFVIGSPSLDDDGDATHDTRMFFEKSTGAFRVGSVTDTRWDAAERGTNSVAMGLGSIARGGSSLSLGQNNLAHSASSVAIGTNNVAEGYNSVALGRNVATTGTHSMALSLYSASRSYGETTMGIYAADYVPNSTTNFDGNDRLFTIGNGLDDGNRSNAFVILKNGDATLLGTLTESSDMRLKRNIKPLQNSLFSLNNLQGVHYQWNGRKPQDTLALQTGLIAQEVEKIFPELVKKDEEGFKSVNYIGVIPHLIEAIKELKKENEELKSETEKAKASTEQRIAAMEARLMKIEALAEKANR